MSQITDAYDRGFQHGKQFGTSLDSLVRTSTEWAMKEYPLLAGLDLVSEVTKFDKQRMASPPSVAKFPEAKNIPAMVEQERKGFRDATNATDEQLAFNYSWHFFYSRRINTRYIGKSPTPAECSAVFLAESAEGGPLYGRNWDVAPNEWAKAFIEPPRVGADGKRVMFMKGVSCSVFLDDEPAELFPLDPFAIMPGDVKTVKDGVEFLQRYCDFWGPTNTILVDEKLDSVAIEKANCRMGVRHAGNGTSAVGACAHTIPEMKTFKDEKDLESIKRRGWTIDNAPDWGYWRGAEARYRRILKLTDELAKRASSATLEDMGAIMTDHAVPYPERVCLAGESKLGEPHEREWTMCSHSEVLEGPNRRIHFFVAEDGKPCYETPPYLVPGEGVAIKPEWKKSTRPLPEKFTRPRPRIHAEYPAMRMML